MIKKTQSKPFCAVPFTTAFTYNNIGFRDCCTRYPQIISQPDQNFANWWHSNELVSFRHQLLTSNQWPSGCEGCQLREASTGTSFRLAVNQEVSTCIDYTWPSAWNINFGNICNLGCWTCSERCSSVIHNHKTRSGIKFPIIGDAQQQFETNWPELKNHVLTSYDHHDVVSLTVLGGEPLYNPVVQDFLQELIESDLASRTRLFFHTNATIDPSRTYVANTIKDWKYLCVFLSLDSVGRYAEWLRYGTRWTHIENNIPSFLSLCDYVEIHATVSVLNINQLPELLGFSQQHQLNLRLQPMSNPDFMSLEAWDLGADALLILPMQDQFRYLYDLIGADPITGSADKLKSYIRSFDAVRDPLSKFCPEIARKLGW
jgi:organic radical activating enzyme